MPNLNQKTYKIGTRGSLLALTQCNQIKDQLEKITGDKFELDVIKTQGDLITSAPLWQLDGKDFFTKELDEALLSGRVDLVVHSYKDLGSIRPEGIQLAAVTKRTFAHDILLIKQETIATIERKSEFVVGTSSPRRMVNLEKHLADFLPYGSDCKITTKVLRGNVNSRIQKLRDNEYDAIVLALPGIERLALTESSRIELTRLLKGINFMVLPQSVFTSSASQGALGIECTTLRNDDNELFLKLQKLEDPSTKAEVSRERVAFNKYGGGCHLAVGINVRKLTLKNNDYFIHTHKGFLEEQNISLSFLEGRALPALNHTPKIFNGLPFDDRLIQKKMLSPNLDGYKHLFVTSKYCIESIKKAPHSLWAAGTKTMSDLASLGFWVNASADSLGEEEISNLRKSKAISLMINTEEPLTVLSSDQAESTLGEIVACYTRDVQTNLEPSFVEKINQTELFYWTSFFQYQTYMKTFPQLKERLHACGIGKTFKQFQKNNIEVIPMASMEELKNWINKI